MKEFLLMTALLLPIILGLDVGLCNVVIAVAVWITTIIKWVYDKELQQVCNLSIRQYLQDEVSYNQGKGKALRYLIKGDIK